MHIGGCRQPQNLCRLVFRPSADIFLDENPILPYTPIISAPCLIIFQPSNEANPSAPLAAPKTTDAQTPTSEKKGEDQESLEKFITYVHPFTPVGSFIHLTPKKSEESHHMKTFFVFPPHAHVHFAPSSPAPTLDSAVCTNPSGGTVTVYTDMWALFQVKPRGIFWAYK